MNQASSIVKSFAKNSTALTSKLTQIQLAHLNSKTFESDDSLDSEKSYETLLNKSEVYETVTYLTFNLVWLFVIALASVISFVVVSYKVIFDPSIYQVLHIVCVSIVCNLIIVVDIVAAIVHTKWIKFSLYRDLKPRPKGFIVIDFIGIVWMLFDYFPKPRKFEIAINTIILLFLIFRLHRAIWFFYVVSEKPGTNTVGIMLKKYGVVIFLFTHTCACFHVGITKYTKEDTPIWTTIGNSTYYVNSNVPIQLYIIAMYYSIGTIASVGIGDLYPLNDEEKMVMNFQLIIAFFLVAGAFIGAWTTVQVNVYSRHSNFKNRLNLIKRTVSNKNVTVKLRQLFLSHYRTVWNELKAVEESDLLERLPEGLTQQLDFDHYWNAFQESYVLKKLHPAFLRALASTMSTEIYATDELIYIQGDAKNAMIFVQRGTIQILSTQDGESAVLSLGVGTCFGETNLVYSYESPVTIRASTYVIVQRLLKKEFWIMAHKYRRLQQIKEFRARMKNKIESATENHRNKVTIHARNLDPSLKTVRTLLRDENTIITNDGMGDNLAYSFSVFETTLKDSDKIFLKTKFPWILQPESQFLDCWEYVVCALALSVGIFYPFQISYIRRFSKNTRILTSTANFVFTTDVLFKTCTAVETKTGIVTSISGILSERKSHPSFIMDILSVMPLNMLSYCIDMDVKRLSSFLMINHLLKLYRVIKFLGKYGVTLTAYFTFIRCTKYIIYLLLISYFMGAIFYLLACFNETCTEQSWFIKLAEEDAHTKMIRHKHPFETSFFFALSLVVQQGSAGVIPRTTLELMVTILYIVIALLVFCYLVADYSATVTLMEKSKEDFIEIAYLVKNYLNSNNISKSIQHRTNNYLQLQWSYNKGYYLLTKRSLLYDAPKHLMKAFQTCLWHDHLLTVPLFQELDCDTLQKLACNKVLLLLPPNDIIEYAGNIVKYMYIIESGYCELISCESGKIEKILGPYSSFCHFDMLLDRPGLFTVRTLTHVRLLKFTSTDVKQIINKSDKFLNELVDDVKRTNTVKRLFTKTNVKTDERIEKTTPSWFVFSKRKINNEFQEYENGFKKMNIWGFLRYFLLRRTIIPNGNFIIIWELIQAVRIFIMCVVANIVPLIQTYYPEAIVISIIVNILTLVDMYIRMHLCYYNKKGILVTHPRYTARYYLTTTFCIDFLTVLPIPFIYDLMVQKKLKASEMKVYDVQLLLSLHKLLQIYRIPGAFYYFEKDFLRPAQLTLNAIKLCLISVILINSLAIVMMTISTDVKLDSSGALFIEVKDNSWIVFAQKNFAYNITQPFNLYITQLYFVLNGVLLIQFGDTVPQKPNEIFFNVVLMLIGYLLFTYMLVEKTSCRINTTSKLTTYQQHMHHLIAYLKKENISKPLLQKTINYYEYIWKKKHRLDTSDVLNICHFTLKEDLVLNLYEDVLKSVTVFAHVGRSFYSILGMQVEEEMYIENLHIIRLNSVVNMFYIVRKGIVKVVAPDGSVFVTLTPGCVFGHIDNTRSSRSMVSVVSVTEVDVLWIPTEKMYSIIKDYPSIGRKLERHILLENLSYIDNKGVLSSRRKTQIETENKKPSSLFIKIILYPLLNMITSLFTCIVVSYHWAFIPNSYLMLGIIYIFDLIHGIILYNKPFIFIYGVNSQLYLKRRDHIMNIGIEIFALVPFEILILAVPTNSILYYMTWCRLNRMFRMWNIFNYFSMILSRLNIRVSLTSLCEVGTYFFLTIHIGACVLQWAACPNNVCSKDSWIFDADGNNLCGNYYVCSLYFINNIVTFTALGDITPRRISEVLVYMVLALFLKFISTLLMGNVSAIIQNHSNIVSAFDYDLATLKQYLQNNSIELPLIGRTMVYVNRLWDRNQGVQLPILLHKAPYCLIEEIKVEAYGHHIYKSYIFESCHKDLLRMIISKLQVETYFRGDIICHQGAVNHNMFFIHTGLVNMYENVGFEQNFIQELKQSDCFGTLQGLLSSLPHGYTYKAETVCVILKLHLLDWIQFLRFYKAAKQEIYTRIYHV